MKKFWMVIGEHSSNTSRRHYTYQAARVEAERLTRQEGKAFAILEAVMLCHTQPIPVVMSPILSTYLPEELTTTGKPVDEVPF